MFRKILLPETIAQQDGAGTEVALERGSKSMLLTLGITRIIEKEILNVSVWGSKDGKHWQQIAAFPRKFYCGTYSMLLDLARHPGIQYLRAQWKMDRWTLDGERKPLFGFYLTAEDVRSYDRRVRHAGAA
jgi:hypothetical protein